MAYCIQTVILTHQPSIPCCAIKPWYCGVKGGKNKHYSKPEPGEWYCDALKEDMTLMNKQLYLLPKSNISIFMCGKVGILFLEKQSINSLFHK